ncbi:uncharacterized protein FIBRA_06251 [Fibroporia radiculosa]|uniref:Methyltransferase domain-containing protein n=1 Tax=Fibroporia radiculosa TaxID=599839 RepID=J4HYT9_9APHY|nr:uncharacterized protein FIBRA_06251 [Fibroporia radiculosa]CCM04092.1 predicted protein [Fibroporia radiculosa]
MAIVIDPASQSSDDDARSNTSSELTELDPGDFPQYFRENLGRLFHSHGQSPYPLPVDAAEQHRLNRQHALLQSLIRGLFVGPVNQALSGINGRKNAVDLCTGTGKWVMDMALMFPHVKFHGLDIVPIQTRHPLPNVYFVIHDVAAGLDYTSGTVDLVHARDISYAVRNYHQLLCEVMRVLRPGGLFVAGEWAPYPSMGNIYNIRDYAPRTWEYFDLLRMVLSNREISTVPTMIRPWMEQLGFVNIEVREYRLPVNGRHATSFTRRTNANLQVYVESLQPMMADAGYGSRARSLANLMFGEISRVDGIFFTYYAIHGARRARA